MNFLADCWNFIKKLGLIVALITTLIGGGWIANHYDIAKAPTSARQLIVEGDNALNMGRYRDAQRIFEAELKDNPQNKQAAWNLKIAKIGQTLAQPGFKDAIDILYQQNPNDAHVNLFLGQFYNANNQVDKAMQHYNAAIRQNWRLTDAYYNLALLYDQLGNYEAAKVESLRAINLSPTAKYRNNLGTIYFKEKNYEQAIGEYSRNKKYPLSALESAKIYWRLEYLSQALSYQKQAIEWLEDKALMAEAENEDAWHFEIAPGKEVELMTLDEKKSYGYLCLSVSLFLQGYEEGAASMVKKSQDLNVVRQFKINALLTADLDALILSNDNFSKQATAFKALFL
ncbi:tetratricopeptide repeat protein [Methylobacter psychrophilus]|uniref:tetratricopeptide repeat protein n=1 Tax=Methylobacter psychrophilus TaxID=96941 RepID=UPI0021D4D85B|nr:tetratricopeptide repeat protein [Methylobacter psychrophilus]